MSDKYNYIFSIIFLQTPTTGDGFYELNEALKKNSIYTLIIFLIGLKNTKQEHLFHLFCTEEFCNELTSSIDKCCSYPHLPRTESVIDYSLPENTLETHEVNEIALT